MELDQYVHIAAPMIVFPWDERGYVVVYVLHGNVFFIIEWGVLFLKNYFF
jgi:hypothetical protein